MFNNLPSKLNQLMRVSHKLKNRVLNRNVNFKPKYSKKSV